MLKIGDIVAIRGDKRLNMDGKCAYTSDQLIYGKYLKHTGHGGIWLGPVQKIDKKMSWALVGGIWRDIKFYEKMI